MKRKDSRLHTASVGQVRPVKKAIENFELDPITAVAMIMWSVTKEMVTKHGFNGGTNEDQVKILMQNMYERDGVSIFTVDDVLAEWNKRVHGKPHTRAQVVSVIQSLKSKGKILTVDSESNDAGRPIARYSLAKVLGRETTPEEVKDEPLTDDNEVSDGPVGLVLTNQAKFSKRLEDHFKGLAQVLAINDTSNSEMRDSYNSLIEKLSSVMARYQEIFDHNVNSAQTNADQFATFVQDTNHNFTELAEYFQAIQAFMAKFETPVGSDSKTFREGYRAGFKDGREEYREELTLAYRREPKELDKHFDSVMKSIDKEGSN